VGTNPHHYATNSSIHGWIDGGFFNRMGGADLKGMQARARPAQALMYKGHEAAPEEIFPAVMEFLLEQEKQVEPLYKLNQDGKLTAKSDGAAEGKAFLENQLLKSVQLLGDIWFTAWSQAGEDSYLSGQLVRRKNHK
jgi:hypothetical protein